MNSRNHSGPWRRAPAAWLFFAFLYIPILVLVVLSFNSGQSATLWESFSLKWYAVVADPEILRAAKTRCSSPPPSWAYPGHPRRAWRARSRAGRMNGVLGLPLLVPEIVTAVATLMFFFIGLKLSLFTILIAHRVLHPLRLPADPRPPGGPDAGGAATRPLRLAVEGLLENHPAAADARRAVRGDARVHHLDGRFRHHLFVRHRATALPVYIFSSIRMGISRINAISSIILAVSARLRRPVVLPRPTPLRTCLHEETEDRQSPS